ncbi:hypothetical protein [Bosea sp. (in: a-proteobacteria)]|jgi:hypothetical protein|uniref:hypothetical protein n=1 Tax=Bosea sp. (in: a-proteobacteria) TaxID=1871050 RepID=UPI00086A7358|nr:hypothetical protein [Bosea sp. (in: a-proteobacteria)]MBN9439743.1 hypothetical protein [Bosea sp. (in: a-proteobacteria)]MBN9472178.1 hypothetical protein [Bosea sp. (in: a-proteobacteria)]ODT43427.1 MAG: hypothetical protein ABS59_23550 [Methylobacterium sp. SCN 67-24]
MATRIKGYPQFERAMHRLQELSGFPEGSPEHREMQALEQALHDWEQGEGRAFDDESVWPEGPQQHFCSALSHGDPAVQR